jgi:hypothetical protein
MEKSDYIAREYRESDLDSILDLWEKHSGWGRPGKDEFKKWLDTPFGDCYVIVLEDVVGNIVGQIIYTPTELYINGEKFSVLKASAPIVIESLRAGSLFDTNSLILFLITKGFDLVKDKGYAWFYSFPAHGWIRLINNLHHFGLNRWKTEMLPCFEVDENNEKINTFRIELLDDFSVEIRDIWETFKIMNSELSFFTRDMAWLNYKWGDCLKLGLYSESDNMAGYAVIKPDSGLLEDLILKDMNLIPDALIQLSVFFSLYSKSCHSNTPATFKFMPNGFIRRKMNEIKVKSVNYLLPFAISSITDFDGAVSMDLEKWYVFPNN